MNTKKPISIRLYLGSDSEDTVIWVVPSGTRVPRNEAGDGPNVDRLSEIQNKHFGEGFKNLLHVFKAVEKGVVRVTSIEEFFLY